MSTIMCPGFKNISYEQGNLPPVRIALLNGCPLISTILLVLNSIISSLKRPYVFSFHKTYGTIIDGKWTGMYKELVDNRSDICVNYNSITYEKFRSMYLSPIIHYSNTISILSGKIYANTGNSFSLFSSFSTDLWIIFGISLIIVAILNPILHLISEITSFLKLWVQVSKNLFTLVMYFFSQSSQNFSRICCAKHLLLNSMTIISIFLLTNFFTSNILSILVDNPLLKIDSLQDLDELLSRNPNIEVMADNKTTSWKMMKEYPNQRVSTINKRLKNVPTFEFDYRKVYHGKAIIISHDIIMENMMALNPHLDFRISRDRYYGTMMSLLYSKNIEPGIKVVSDSVISRIFQSGITKSTKYRKRFTRIINMNDFVVIHESISFVYFKQVIIMFLYSTILLAVTLVVECFYSSLVKFLSQS